MYYLSTAFKKLNLKATKYSFVETMWHLLQLLRNTPNLLIVCTTKNKSGFVFAIHKESSPHMLHHHFQAIATHADLRHLLVAGTCIGEREAEGLPILLFQLEQGYAEVILNSKGSEVLSYRNFDDTEELEPYLHQINISLIF